VKKLSFLLLLILLGCSTHEVKQLIEDGKLFYQKGNYILAIDKFDQAIKTDPNNLEAYYRKVEALRRYGRSDDALLWSQKAVAVKPRTTDAYYYRGKIKQYLEDWLGSNEDFSLVIKRKPNDPKAYFRRGISNFALERKNDALMDFSKSGELGLTDAYSVIRSIQNNDKSTSFTDLDFK